MRAHNVSPFVLAIAAGLAPTAWAQSDLPAFPEVALCDPYIVPGTDNRDNGNDDPIRQNRRVRYDLEKAQTITSEQAIMDALYEEKWDVATGAPVERAAICEGTQAYIVNWAEVMGAGDDGQPAVIADGLFRLKKDGTFEFTYNKRPYGGTWKVENARMSLTAPWLNKGEPITSPVDLVTTPVEYGTGDGQTDSFDLTAYRIGPFRLQPIDTTVPGAIQDCACPAK